MNECLLYVRLIRGQTIQDDGICALAIEFDLTFGRTNDRRHPLASRVELQYVEDLKFVRSPLNVDVDRFRFSSL